MDVVLQLLTYASGLVFAVAFAVKLIRYATMPMHVRWELYPVPHEGKAWGGSFYEELDHWKKARHKDHWAQYRFMVPEILFIRALYEDNRPLWYWSFPFHMGLYLCFGGLVFLVIGAILEVAGLPPSASALATFVQALTQVFGVVGFIFGAVGAMGLVIKRMTDPSTERVQCRYRLHEPDLARRDFCHRIPRMACRSDLYGLPAVPGEPDYVQTGVEGAGKAHDRAPRGQSSAVCRVSGPIFPLPT